VCTKKNKSDEEQDQKTVFLESWFCGQENTQIWKRRQQKETKANKKGGKIFIIFSPEDRAENKS